MLSQAVSIGSFEAKTKFSELLRNVEAGMIYSITRNGKSVAVLQSAETKKQSEGMAAFTRISRRAEKLRGNKDGFSVQEIIRLKNEGRKY